MVGFHIVAVCSLYRLVGVLHLSSRVLCSDRTGDAFVIHGWHIKVGSDIAKVGEHGIDKVEGLVDFLADLGTSQDEFSTDENKKHDFGSHHAIDETREEFGFVGAEHMVAAGQTLKTNWKLDVARPNDIVNLELGEFSVEAQLLTDTSVVATCKLAIVFKIGASDDHPPRGKNERRRLGFADTHDHSCETLGGDVSWKSLVQRCALTFGLCSALRACSAMVFRSRRQSRLTVATTFFKELSTLPVLKLIDTWTRYVL